MEKLCGQRGASLMMLIYPPLSPLLCALTDHCSTSYSAVFNISWDECGFPLKLLRPERSVFPVCPLPPQLFPFWWGWCELWWMGLALVLTCIALCVCVCVCVCVCKVLPRKHFHGAPSGPPHRHTCIHACVFAPHTCICPCCVWLYSESVCGPWKC